MSVSSNIPQITALKESVERVLGEPLLTHNAFINLVCAIERAQNDHMSESTLERLCGYSTRSCSAVSLRSLNVLSRFVGVSSWEDFCRKCKEETGRESEEILGEYLEVSSLAPGTRLRLGWLPDRIIEVEYLGFCHFRVASSINSSISAGDEFSCLQIRKGRELYLDKYRRCGSAKETYYVVGQLHGITTLEILP